MYIISFSVALLSASFLIARSFCSSNFSIQLAARMSQGNISSHFILICTLLLSLLCLGVGASWRLERAVEHLSVNAISTAENFVLGLHNTSRNILIYDGSSISSQYKIELEPQKSIIDFAASLPSPTSSPILFLLVTHQSPQHKQILQVTKILRDSDRHLVSETIFEGESCGGGGSIAIASDGSLYIGVADAAGASASAAQNFNSLCGKILRIYADGIIPSDNPFSLLLSGNLRAVWAIGLRNPTSLTFSSRGALFIQDSGPENGWHEINIGQAGANYGWPIAHGGAVSAQLKRVFEYQRTSPAIFSFDRKLACSSSGGSFLPSAREEKAGSAVSYLFADRCGGRIIALSSTSAFSLAETFLNGLGRVVDMTSSTDGSVYILSETGNGSEIHRLKFDFEASFKKRQSTNINDTIATMSTGEVAATSVLTPDQLRPLQLQFSRFLTIAPARLQITSNDNSSTLQLIITTLPSAPATAALLMTRLVFAINDGTISSPVLVPGTATTKDLVNSTLTPAPPKPKNPKSSLSVATKAAIIVGTIGGVAILILLAIACYVYLVKVKKIFVKEGTRNYSSTRTYMRVEGIDEREMYARNSGQKKPPAQPAQKPAARSNAEA